MTPEELLDELHAAGRVDSQGKFTLAGEKALEKLRKFQLRHPADYLLFAIRAAVAAQATELWIEFSLTRIRIRAADWVPPRREDLISGLFESPDLEPAAYYLGVVANTVQVSVDGGGITIEHPFTPLRLVRAVKEWSLLTGLRPWLPARLGKRPLPRPSPVVSWPGTDIDCTLKACRVRLAPTMRSRSQFQIYKHGVSVTGHPALVLPGPAVDCHVQADFLNLDLTGRRVVEDERWKVLVEELHLAVGEVVERLCGLDLLRAPAIRQLLLRALIDRCQGTRARLKVSRTPVALGMPPPEIVRPSTRAMACLVDTAFIELQEGYVISPRQLAQTVAWGPPPASGSVRSALPAGKVLANVSPALWAGAGHTLFLGTNSLALLEAWPSQPVSL